MVDVDWIKIMIIYELVTNIYTTIFCGCATILYHTSDLSVMNESENGPIASESLPDTADLLRIGP